MKNIIENFKCRRYVDKKLLKPMVKISFDIDLEASVENMQDRTEGNAFTNRRFKNELLKKFKEI